MNASFNSGIWQSDFHPLSIHFNENVWRLVNDGHDNEQGALFGLFSENDGASFSLDLALKPQDLNYDYDFAEAEFYSRMFNLDNQCQRLATIDIEMGALNFTCNRYAFNNQKFGPQLITRAMHISQSFVIGMGMAWPQTLENIENSPLLIPKFGLLTEQLKLPKEQDFVS